MGSNFVQENQPYPPFGRLPRLGRRVLAALAEINPNRHLVALLPRLGRLIPLICFAKGKQANQPSALKSNLLISSKKKDPRGSFSVVGSLRFLSFHHLFWRIVHGGAEGFVFFVLCRELEAAGECGVGFELEVVFDEVVVFEVGVFDHG